MRGDDGICGSLFSYIDLGKRVRADHPLRVIRQIVNAALKSLSADFGKLYSPIGRGSIPPERLMRAMLLQAFYSSVRSGSWSSELITICCFAGLSGSASKMRCGMPDVQQEPGPPAGGEVASKLLTAVLSQNKVRRLLSSDHFSVDGTLLEAWASPKSFRAKDGSGEPPEPGRNGERNFHGERRANDTHASITDPDALLFRKGPGKEARLCFMGHALMENRNGLIVGAVTTRTSGHAERLAALALIEPYAERPQPVTLGADKGYDASDFVMELRDKAVTPHIAQNQSGRRSAIDGRATRHVCYALSQRIRKRIEEAFRLGQNSSRVTQNASSRAAQGRLAIQPGNGRLRSDPPTQIARRTGSLSLLAWANCTRTNTPLPIPSTRAPRSPITYLLTGTV
jgi:hypothetical protein